MPRPSRVAVIPVHLAELLKDVLHRLKTGQPIPLVPEDELDLHETAQLLKLRPAEVVQLHHEGVLTSTGRLPLKFYREDVLIHQANRELRVRALGDEVPDLD